MEIARLSKKEQEQLYKLLEKAGYNFSDDDQGSNPEDPNRGWGEAPKPNPAVVRRILSKEDWIRKQIDTLKAVGKDNYIIGIRNPKKDPIKAGIEAQARYEEQMKKKEVLERRKKALEKTNIDEWVAVAETLGADKLVDGVVARQFKVERFLDAYIPALEDHLRKIDAMPNVTDADREKKMIENLRGLKKLKGIHRR